MRQQLGLASELKSELLDTVDWGKKQLVDFDEEKYSIDSFDRSNNSGVIDVKMDESVLKKEKWICRAIGTSLAATLD